MLKHTTKAFIPIRCTAFLLAPYNVKLSRWACHTVKRLKAFVLMFISCLSIRRVTFVASFDAAQFDTLLGAWSIDAPLTVLTCFCEGAASEPRWNRLAAVVNTGSGQKATRTKGHRQKATATHLHVYCPAHTTSLPPDKRPLIIKLERNVPYQLINVIFSTERRIFSRGR